MDIAQLKALIATHAGGSQARFALMLGKSPSQVNQWLAGKRPIGAKIERDIAARFGDDNIPSITSSSKPNPQAALESIELACAQLSQDQRQEVGTLLSMFAANPRASIKAALLEVLCAPSNKEPEVKTDIIRRGSEKFFKNG
jgi:transcriptional regulator with XRE-family HTH domain